MKSRFLTGLLLAFIILLPIAVLVALLLIADRMTG